MARPKTGFEPRETGPRPFVERMGPQEIPDMLRRLTTRLYDNAYLLLSFMALCWAGNQVLGRAVAGHIPPIAYSFLRWSLATVIVLPFALPHVRRDWPVVRT